MRCLGRAAVVFSTTALAACDALLVAPQAGNPGAVVQLSLAPSEEADANFSEVLEKVDQVRLTIRVGAADSDTVLPARLVNGELVARLYLGANALNELVEVVADLELLTGEPLFTGRAEVHTGVVGPHVHVDVAPVVATLSMTRLDPIESLGGSTALEAVARFATGDEISDAEIEWTSDAPEILEVRPGPVVLARANGAAELTASSQGESVGQVVRVHQRPVLLTGIAPTDTTISVGESFRMRVIGTDALGHQLLPGSLVHLHQYDSGVLQSNSITWIVTGLSPGQREIEMGYLLMGHWRSTITVID